MMLHGTRRRIAWKTKALKILGKGEGGLKKGKHDNQNENFSRLRISNQIN